jgi:hypothetical protein
MNFLFFAAVFESLGCQTISFFLGCVPPNRRPLHTTRALNNNICTSIRLATFAAR